MSRVLVLSGADSRYADQWHPFAETSEAVAQVVRDMGHTVEVRRLVDPATLQVGGTDLVVVNAGQGLHRPEPDAAWSAGFAGLGDWIDAGGPVLGLHTAANTFTDWPRWRTILGGAWVPDVSEHPRLSVASIQGHPGAVAHPVLAGLPDAGDVLPEFAGIPLVTAVDERYSSMQREPDAVPLLQHLLGDGFEVMGWARGRRVVYDGLGHDARSYRSASRRRLLENEVGWLLDA